MLYILSDFVVNASVLLMNDCVLIPVTALLEMFRVVLLLVVLATISAAPNKRLLIEGIVWG